MKKLNSILFSIIASEVLENAKCGMQNAESGAELDERTLAAVFALAKKHDLGHLILNAKCKVQNAKSGAQQSLPAEGGGPLAVEGECEKHPATSTSEDDRSTPNRDAELGAQLYAELEKVKLTAVWRVRNIENEQGRVRKCLEGAGIPFILLKGAVLRGYYPESWMRTSSDIDVLVPRDKLAEAVKTLTDGYGYRISTVEPHDASLFAPGGVHLDMHTLFEGDGAGGVLTDDAWQSAVSRGGIEHFLTPEYFYVYHIAHMAKHMKNGGPGIRPFIDLYLINSNLAYDREAVESILRERGLDRFERAAVTLSECWMQGSDTAELVALEEYVLTGGVYGSLSQCVAAKRGKDGKLRYITRRIFMPYGELKERYPSLEGRAWLTPIYWVWRWLSLLSPRRFKRSRAELKSAVSLDSESASGVTELFESLGL